MDEQRNPTRDDTPDPRTFEAADDQGRAPGAGSGSTAGGALAGGGLRVTDSETDESASGAPEERPRAPEVAPTSVPSASRTSPSSGIRGTGGGLGDAIGGARRGTASDMTGESGAIGDVSILTPLGGSATQGAAAGAGMSREPADPGPPGDADPSAGTGVSAQAGTGQIARPGDPANTGLGDFAAGGGLDDLRKTLTDDDTER